MSAPVMLSLQQLVPDQRFQPRVYGLDEERIAALMDTEPAEWEPLIVTPIGGGRYAIISGFHRYEAARRLKLRVLPCLVREGAGLIEAIEANARGPLPLSREDLRVNARRLRAEYPSLPLREIARITGLSLTAVHRAIQSGHTDEAAVFRSEQQDREHRPLARLVGQLVKAYGVEMDGPEFEDEIAWEIDRRPEARQGDIAHRLSVVATMVRAAALRYLPEEDEE